MATIAEMKTKRAGLMGQVQALLDAPEREKRDLTPQEAAKNAKLMNEAKNLDAMIRVAEDTELKAEIMALIGHGDDNTAHRTDGGPARGAWSKAFLASDQVWGRGASVGLKQLLPSGSITVPSLSGTLTPLSDNAAVESLLSLIPTETLSGTDQYSCLREKTRTNLAGPVACGSVKPTSILDIERVDGKVEVIATITEPVQRQTLDDSALLGRYIDMVLRAMVKAALENQVVNGDGNSPNLGPGLVLGAGQFQPLLVGGILTCRAAITLLELAEIGLGSAWFALNPTDWEAIEVSQDLVNAFQMGPGQGDARLPVSRSTRRLWGLPVATCLSLAPGTALLVDSGSVMLWERSQATVDWSENTFDPGLGLGDFARNLKRFRCELRAGFLVLRPMGVILIDLVPGS